MPQPVCERPGTITERLLAQESGLDRLWEPLAGRYGPGPGDPGPGGGGFAKYPGWDEKPHPWSQRAGSGDYRGELRVDARGDSRVDARVEPQGEKRAA